MTDATGKTLILGRNGQLAKALAKQWPAKQAIFLGKQDFDLENTNQIYDRIMSLQPRSVICAAAYTSVPGAEKHTQTAFAINHLACGEIAKASHKLNIPLLHFSTDFVFDGAQTRPYTESNAPQPLNVYGESKLLGEKAIANNCDKYFIFRTSWVYSENSGNFLTKIVQNFINHGSIKVVSDETGTPTHCDDLAFVTKQILICQNSNYGLYHLTNAGDCTRFEYAVHILKMLQKYHDGFNQCRIEPVLSTTFASLVDRPNYSVLSSDKFSSQFGFRLRHWRHAVEETIKTINLRPQQGL